MLRALDYGSGYQPQAGYLTADIGGSPALDYHIVNGRVDCPDNNFDLVRMRNVLHHIPDLQPVYADLRRILRPNGKLVIIEPSPECWATNRIQDILWYRYIYCRPGIWIGNTYRNPLDELPPCFVQYSHARESVYTITTFVLHKEGG